MFTWAGFIYNTVLGLEFVHLGTSYLQYSLGFGVCLPGHVLFTIQSWVWSLFTWACLIYNTVLGRNTRKNQGMYKLRHINIVIPLVSYEYGLQALCTFNDAKIPSHKHGKTWSWKKNEHHFHSKCKSFYIQKRFNNYTQLSSVNADQ